MKIATILFSLILSCNAFTAEQQVELLLPGGGDYSVNELPINPSGMWWVVDHVDNGFDLSRKQVTVNKHQGCGDYDSSIEAWRGRTVEVSSASNPIALIRGNLDFTPGALVTADTVLVEKSNILNYSFVWEKQSAFVLFHFEMPKIGKDRHSFKDAQPGKYKVKVHFGGKEMLLYSFEEWDGEGELGVRWIGDINRDGAPDVLLDTWRKYSSRTTRFFISQDSEADLKYFELANFNSNAC